MVQKVILELFVTFEAEMCGNGIRGFAKYVYDRDLISKTGKSVDVRNQLFLKFSHTKNPDFPTLIIETLAGLRKCTIKEVKPTTEGKMAYTIRVDMGEPEIPPPYAHKLEIDGVTYTITRVNVGVPHCVIFVDNFDFDYRTLGRKES